MNVNQIVYYLGSKVLAAVLNLLTMALFVRIGGAETYGGYVLLLAWAYMLYGITMQWLRFSFFACFDGEGGANLTATYLWSLVIGFTGLLAGAIAVTSLGFISWKFAVGLIALIFGLASYDALSEVARTQLRARDVALGVMARAVLMLAFGVAALSFDATPFLLAVAVGVAHIGAALVLLMSSIVPSGGQWSKGSFYKLWRYGYPLVPAFSLDSVGLQTDRLLLARFSTLDMVGTYGAAADFIRQTMIVVAEAIAGAYISVARADAKEGRIAQAAAVLGHAFLAYTALTAFAAVVILRFDRLVFDTLFGAELGAAIEPAVVFIVASNVAGIFRSYYFGQALYLTKSSHILLVSNLAHLLMVASSGLILVPSYGISGAAGAMFLGHVSGCAVCIYSWRDHFVLKLPYAKALAIAAMAAGAYLVTGYVEISLAPAALAIVVNGLIILGVAIVAARMFNVLSFNELSAKAMLLVRRSVGTIAVVEGSDTLERQSGDAHDAAAPVVSVADKPLKE